MSLEIPTYLFFLKLCRLAHKFKYGFSVIRKSQEPYISRYGDESMKYTQLKVEGFAMGENSYLNGVSYFSESVTIKCRVFVCLGTINIKNLKIEADFVFIASRVQPVVKQLFHLKTDLFVLAKFHSSIFPLDKKSEIGTTRPIKEVSKITEIFLFVHEEMVRILKSREERNPLTKNLF